MAIKQPGVHAVDFGEVRDDILKRFLADGTVLDHRDGVHEVFAGMAEPADEFDIDDFSDYRLSRRIEAPFLVGMQFRGIFNQAAACLALAAVFRQNGLPQFAPAMITQETSQIYTK